MRGGRESQRGPAPQPLVEQGGKAGAFLVAAHAAFEPRLGEEARAWAALERRRGRDRRLRGLLAAGGVAVVLGIGLLVLRGDTGRRASPPVVVAPSPATPASLPPPPPTPAPAPREVPPAVPPPAPVALGAGPSVVGAGVRARLSPAGRAAVLPGDPARARIALERGTLEIDADGDAASVEVRAAAYRLEGEPGRFKVSVRPGAVDVAVQKGEVAVWLESRRVARVFAGQRWTDLRATARADAPAPEAAPAEAPRAETPRAETSAGGEPPDCARLGSIDQKLACLEGQASAPGLAGENALWELARTRRDVTGDLAGAERTLGQYLHRFPQGTFVVEATSARVELLLQLGRPAQALADAEHLPGAEGVFWRALCVAQLGRKADARRAFDDYLARPDGQHRKEAARKRAELDP